MTHWEKLQLPSQESSYVVVVLSLLVLFVWFLFKFSYVFGRSYKGSKGIQGNMEISGLSRNDV